jgi:predicted amidohydrolase
MRQRWNTTRTVLGGFFILVAVAGSQPIAANSGDARDAETKAPTLRVAAVSSKCIPGKVAANLERHARWTERAVSRGAQFIGFPECSITGYEFSPDVAITLDGPEVRFIIDLAKKHGVYISAGLVERRNGKMFNTQILAGPRGLLGSVRKINLTQKERKFFIPGAEFPVFDVGGVKVGIAICADATHFETLHVLALRGAQMIFVPHATYLKGTPANWFEWRLARWGLFAQDCCAYLVGCNNAGRFEVSQSDEADLRFASGALIVGPDGQAIERSTPETNIETMIVADLSFDDIERKRTNLFSFTELELDRFYGELMRGSPYAKTGLNKRAKY